jgi:hypothetical protein
MYPREDGHCRCHYIPGTVEDEDNPHDAMLRYLGSIEADLRRGDVIRMYGQDYRNEGVLMFDGQKLIELAHDHDDYGHLPQEFRVIEGGVPLHYWDDDEDDEDADHKRGIAHNRVVWFNHALVREQCLTNLKYGEMFESVTVGLTNYGIYTMFTYSGREYRIIFEYGNIIECDPYSDELPVDKVDGVLAICRALLEKDDLIPFEAQVLGDMADSTLCVRL